MRFRRWHGYSLLGVLFLAVAIVRLLVGNGLLWHFGG